MKMGNIDILADAPEKDGLLWSRIGSGKMYEYAVCEDGSVVKCSRVHYSETEVKPYLRRGAVVVKVNGRELLLKNLVAQHFLKGYRNGMLVECIDSDPFNCCVGNLRTYTMQEHGQRTGWRSGRSQRVVADGVEYRSLRECAKSLYVSYQTLADYLDGAIRHSVLDGMLICRVANKSQVLPQT